MARIKLEVTQDDGTVLTAVEDGVTDVALSKVNHWGDPNDLRIGNPLDRPPSHRTVSISYRPDPMTGGNLTETVETP